MHPSAVSQMGVMPGRRPSEVALTGSLLLGINVSIIV